MSTTAKKAFGQHFLTDDNILGVIGRLAALQTDDVVLEIGPGQGVLTEYLRDRVRHVHAVEIDRSLEPALASAVGGSAKVTLHWGDALSLDLAAFRPAPRKLVANLPYNVATPIVVESLVGLAAVDRWTVMVQREVADRFFAEPGSKAYGAVSVQLRLHTRRIGFHAVSREVFRPRPNVDSALVAFERIPGPASPLAVKRVVEAAFAHRRKTLVNSLVLAGIGARELVAGAVEAAGIDGGARAESLSPETFVALAEALR